MAKLTDLPDEVLVMVVDSLVQLPVTRAEELKDIYIELDACTWIEDGVLPLMLASKRLGRITAERFLASKTFIFGGTEHLNVFVDAAGPGRLALVRKVSIYLQSSESTDFITPKLPAASDPIIADTMQLVRRLPADLAELSLTYPFGPWSEYSVEDCTDAQLKTAVNRFGKLKSLSLESIDTPVHIDIFTRLKAHSNTSGLSQAPAMPKFALLRHLTFGSVLTERMTATDFEMAFSEQHLPSLVSLHLNELLHIISPDDPLVFTPRALELMHPLESFEWRALDASCDYSELLELRHEALGRMHWEALSRRHAATLKRLVVDCGPAYKGKDFMRTGERNMEEIDVELKRESYRYMRDVLIRYDNVHIWTPAPGEICSWSGTASTE